MELLDVGQVARGRDRVPHLDQQLAGGRLGEGRHVVRLADRPGVLLAVVSDLLDDRGQVRGGGRLDAGLDLLEAVQDVLGRDDRLVPGDELGEGDGGLGADEALGDRVEERALVAGLGRGREAHVGQGLVEPVPAGGIRADRAGLHLAGVDAEVAGVLADEVDQDPVEAILVGPGDEVLVGGLEVDHPEAPEERRVHVVDVVLRPVVDGREDPRLWVEAVGDTVLVVAQLAVEDQLEEALLHPAAGAVQLVQADDHRPAAGADEPARHAEGHDAVLLHALDVGVAADIAVGHRGAADVDEGEAQLLGAGLGHVALADAGGPAHEDRDVGGELGGDGGEGLDVHESLRRREGYPTVGSVTL